MINPAADNAQYLADNGEPVTLDSGTSSVPAQAVVDVNDPNAEVLVSGVARFSFVLTMAEVDAAPITPDWTVVVRGKRREVLANPPAVMGLSLVYLGDDLGESC